MEPYEFDRRKANGLATDVVPVLPGLHYSTQNNTSALILAGVDEAGRGPLAGPVVAAAVILPSTPRILGLNDSKKLSAKKRDALFLEIHEKALAIAWSVISPEIIDSINILAAALTAMRDSIKKLKVRPDLVLIDGNQRAGGPYPEQAIVKGDGKSACVMAASIIAKVTRDRIMVELHQQYPHYGFDQHKGYGCQSHVDAIKEYGPSPVHRHSFEPIRSLKKGPSIF